MLRRVLAATLALFCAGAVSILAADYIAKTWYYHDAITISGGDSRIKIYIDCAQIGPERTPGFGQVESQELGFLRGGEIVTVQAASAATGESLSGKSANYVGEYVIQGSVDGHHVELLTDGDGSGNTATEKTQSASMSVSGHVLNEAGLSSQHCTGTPLRARPRTNSLFSLGTKYGDVVIALLTVFGVTYALSKAWDEVKTRHWTRSAIGAALILAGAITLARAVGWWCLEMVIACVGVVGLFSWIISLELDDVAHVVEVERDRRMSYCPASAQPTRRPGPPRPDQRRSKRTAPNPDLPKDKRRQTKNFRGR